ncbi:MAG TPA: hypothetical protein VFG20_06560 [Planctomycetaceae bacterium]|nr:hypothetical protein [Planctomycetaceae bacterium]
MTADVKFRKQISIFISLDDWKAIRLEAAQQHIPMTELCRRWMEPGLKSLRESPQVSTTPRKEAG